MKIKSVDYLEYLQKIKNPFSIFDTVEFARLNAHKINEVLYLIFFDENEIIFGLICGRDGESIKAPYSAPYACFSCVKKNVKIRHYINAINAFLKYAKNLNLTSIYIALPPIIYDIDHISKIYNSLYALNFEIYQCDVNYQYDLRMFESNYPDKLDLKARQKLKSSYKNNLSFVKTDNFEEVYNIISLNRVNKGYPLHMSLQDLKKMFDICDVDLFMVLDANNQSIASAILYKASKEVMQVIYWGDICMDKKLNPMNFMAYKLFSYYSDNNLQIKYVDIGISTENSIPNIGLCDFKQSIGCSASVKISFKLNLTY